MNSIFVIEPYLTESGAVVFDDESKGFVQEPFVAGADVLLLELARLKGRDPKQKFTVLFSNSYFPDAITAHKINMEHDHYGTYYAVKLGGEVKEVWLCPALNLYYPESPEYLYFLIK